MSENLHKDHRKRVRKEFLLNSFDIETPHHKILEMLLFYAIPRKDTNELAHILMKEFGSLSGVIDAAPAQLQPQHAADDAVPAALVQLPGLLQTPGADVFLYADHGKNSFNRVACNCPYYSNFRCFLEGILL